MRDTSDEKGQVRDVAFWAAASEGCIHPADVTDVDDQGRCIECLAISDAVLSALWRRFGLDTGFELSDLFGGTTS